MKVLLAVVAIFGIYITSTVGQDDCVCIEIYQPVCGKDVQTYSNACKAGCAGVAVAFEGECNCVCTQDYSPVCGTNGITYSNECYATCVSEAVSRTGTCDSTPDASNGDTSSDESSNEQPRRPNRRRDRVRGPRGQRQRGNSELCGWCRYLLRIIPDSSLFDDQACYEGVTYDNKCDAICQGRPESWRDVDDGACPEPEVPVPPICRCPRIYRPVCYNNNNYSNECLARCAGASPDGEISDGFCSTQPEPCFCPAVYQPVCGRNGQTYGNTCEATCADVVVVSQGECPPA